MNTADKSLRRWTAKGVELVVEVQWQLLKTRTERLLQLT
jgi:hypothetical protein